MKYLKMMIVCVLFAMSFGYVSAISTSNTKDKSFNVELVVDASGSLKQSDRENYRYDALRKFMLMLPKGKNEVGAVVFTHQIEKNIPLSVIKTDRDGEKLCQEIESIQPAGHADTNIGLALKTAVDNLKKINNDHEKLILLISDGETDLISHGGPEATAKALQNEKAAVQSCQEQDISIYSIFLNYNNNARGRNEIEGLTINRKNLKPYEIKSADQIETALEHFYENMIDIVAPEREYSYSSLTKTIEVPSFGVREFIVTLENAADIRQVEIQKPNGVKLAESDVNALSQVIGSKRIIKVTNDYLAPKNWIITVLGQSGKRISCSVILNPDTTAVLSVDRDTYNFSTGESVTLKGTFFQSGTEVMEADKYADYHANLILESAKTGRIYTFRMDQAADYGFTYALQPSGEDTYRASVEFTSGSFKIKSDQMVLNFGNSAPVFHQQKANIKIGTLFGGGNYIIDLSKIFSDQEGERLKYRIIASDYDINQLQLNDDKLLISHVRNGGLTIEAVDSYGASVEGVLNVKVVSYFPMILALIVIIGGVLLFILLKGKSAKHKVKFIGSLVIRGEKSDVIVHDDRVLTGFTNQRMPYLMRDFGLSGLHFSDDTHFEVDVDKQRSGNSSVKLTLKSEETFYVYVAPEHPGDAVRKIQLRDGDVKIVKSSPFTDMTTNDAIKIKVYR